MCASEGGVSCPNCQAVLAALRAACAVWQNTRTMLYIGGGGGKELQLSFGVPRGNMKVGLSVEVSLVQDRAFRAGLLPQYTVLTLILQCLQKY